MIRLKAAAALLIGLLILGAVPALARHDDDGDHEGELARARRDLADAERAHHFALADLSRARAAFDAAETHRAHLASLLDAALRNAQSARASVELAKRNLDRLHAEHAQLDRDLAAITRGLDAQRLRAEASRRHADSLRARLVSDFESSRPFRDALAAADASRARTAHVEAQVLAHVQASPHYRHLNADVQHHRALVERLESGWFVDHWRLAAAKRNLADAKRRRDDYLSRTVESDPHLLAARADAARAQSHLDHLRDRFSHDLGRHPQLRAAQDAVAQEDATLYRMESDLAAARDRCAALGIQIEAQHRTLVAATHQLQCAEAEIATHQRDLDQATGALHVAESHFARAAEREQHARAHRDRAARRVADLDDRRGNGRWHDDRDGRERGRRFRDN
jgi:chromosome segregation ATPase